MNYRKDRYGNDLSILGYGCMRFSRKLGKIDVEKAEKEMLLAYENGVNYFDTAYIYPGSEEVLGNFLEKNKIRDKVYIATKLPHSFIKSKKVMEEIFNEQLKRLKTDYIDFYLMHMLTDIDTWKDLISLGILDWLEEKKKDGKIKQIGFSYHGNSQMFCELIDGYDWDFCQIQYNYMDEHTQAGRTGLNYANSKGIPVIIMEPLRGGKLVNKLPKEAVKIFSNYEKQLSPAGWAFSWLWNQPEITVVLSGMNNEEMVLENIKTASNINVGDFTDKDEEMLKSVVKEINSKIKVGCTGCGYCMPCHRGVDIPGVFAAYNRKYTEGKFASFVEYIMCTVLRKNVTYASNCVKCKKCEIHCPQGIKISEKLEEVQREMETPFFKFVVRIIKRFSRY